MTRPQDAEAAAGLTDRKTWWFLENTDGRWLENYDHGTFTSDPNAAMRWPNKTAAVLACRGMRHPLWHLTATEHAWVPAAPTPSGDLREAVARLIDPSKWRVLDSYLRDVQRRPNAGYDPDNFKDRASLQIAGQIVALIAANNGGRG